MPNFAANLSWMFQEWSFLDRFAAAADAGFRAVEYLFPYDHAPGEIAKRLADNKQRVVLFNLPPGDLAGGERGLAALADRRDDFRASIEAGLRYALATGAPRLHLMAGNASGAAAMATYKDALRFACDTAGRHGLDILIEPLNRRDAPNYLLNDFGLAERLIAELKLPNLKLQFDIYHRQIIHGDVVRGLETLLPITGHIQVASVPGRHEPTTGELDDLRVFETLERLDYQGFVGCEYTPAAGTLAGLGWLKRVASARL
jgi:hydroxypyruvate isomerase